MLIYKTGVGGVPHEPKAIYVCAPKLLVLPSFGAQCTHFIIYYNVGCNCAFVDLIRRIFHESFLKFFLHASACMHACEFQFKYLMSMSKYWLLTSFEEDFEVHGDCEYGVYQREMCPSTNREHWQAFLVFKSRKRFDSVKRLYPNAHIEVMRGSVWQSIEYCRKLDSRIWGPYEVGTRPAMPKAAVSVLDQLRTKRPIELLEENPKWWRSLKNLNQLAQEVISPRSQVTTGVILYGKTGTGKSKIAHLISQFLGGAYWVEPEMKWWDSYTQEELVVCDEYRCQASTQFLLRLLDRYPLRVPYKGGFAQFKSRMVVITSNLDFEQMFSSVDERTKLALRRRIICLEVY